MPVEIPDKLKKLTRARMARTGENYTTARLKILVEQGRAPNGRPAVRSRAPEPVEAAPVEAPAFPPLPRTGSLEEHKRNVDERGRQIRAAKAQAAKR
jgi:hypothetical protein